MASALRNFTVFKRSYEYSLLSLPSAITGEVRVKSVSLQLLGSNLVNNIVVFCYGWFLHNNQFFLRCFSLSVLDGPVREFWNLRNFSFDQIQWRNFFSKRFEGAVDN
jgi:hypothetical protein